MPFRISPSERIDALNIGLMLFSVVIAIFIPLELFLISYLIFGPLHYLTEISWLHDKKYYTKGRYDAVALLLIGIAATVAYYSFSGIFALDFPGNFNVWLAYIALFSAAIFALVKSKYLRIVGLLLIVLSSQLAEHFALFLTVFLPTLIHVYIFTGLFMLYGALKSKSRLGIASVIVLALCPVLLFTIAPGFLPFGFSSYGQQLYFGDHGKGFIMLHITTLSEFFNVSPPAGVNTGYFWLEQVYHSNTGLLVLRFIAFAYTYHYLNWFSKTRIIQWHKVPRARFIGVLAFWIMSLAICLYDYTMGMMWLFFLSYAHVLLELPLNMTSVAGIGSLFRQRVLKPAVQKA